MWWEILRQEIKYINFAVGVIRERTDILFLFGTVNEESVSESDDNVIEEVVDLARQINLEVGNDDVQELLDSYYKELTIDDEPKEMHEQEQGIEVFEFLDTVQSEDRITVENLIGLSLI
ncbi:hypothetical protein TNCV_4797071 [Trichonephila clavipes]|nr:hypothetical protein TNCV_4797071 [Trichonephila clavipes]